MSILLYESVTSLGVADDAFYILEVRYDEALKCNQAARYVLLAEGLSPYLPSIGKRYTLPGELTDPIKLERLQEIKAYIEAGAPCPPPTPPPPPPPAPSKALETVLCLIPIAGVITAGIGEITKRLK